MSLFLLLGWLLTVGVGLYLIVGGAGAIWAVRRFSGLWPFWPFVAIAAGVGLLTLAAINSPIVVGIR